MSIISNRRILMGQKSVQETLKLLAISKGMLDFDFQWKESPAREQHNCYCLQLMNKNKEIFIQLNKHEIASYPFGSDAKKIRILCQQAINKLYELSLG